MRKLFLLLTLSILFTGCAGGPPKYVRPEPPVPAAWPANPADSSDPQVSPPAADVKWQDFFADPKLRSVIDLALKNNRDLRMSALNVQRVEAQYRIQSAGQYPTIGVSANGQVYRSTNDTSNGNAGTLQQHTVNFGLASWELDLFGRIRSLKSEALEQYLATNEARTAAQISLVAAVGNTYLACAADRELLELARVTLKNQQATLELITHTRDVGIASDLDVRQAESQVEAARVDIAKYSGQLRLDENALNLLAGTPVDASLLPADLNTAGDLKDISPGLSSEVLLNRPDILMAEHQLKAANADIGVARADFFPRISLTTGLGLVASDLAGLFKPGAGTWAFAPGGTLPIFDKGARRANMDAVRMQRDISVAGYEKAIQSAFREVSDALSLRTTLVAQQDAQQALLKTLQDTYDLSEARYQGGIDSYLSVLIAQRALYVAQQQMVGIRFARQSNLVTLYKVLGGGA